MAVVVSGAAVLPWWAARRATGISSGRDGRDKGDGGRAGRLAAAAAVVVLLAFGVARWSPTFAWAAP